MAALTKKDTLMAALNWSQLCRYSCYWSNDYTGILSTFRPNSGWTTRVSKVPSTEVFFSCEAAALHLIISLTHWLTDWLTDSLTHSQSFNILLAYLDFNGLIYLRHISGLSKAYRRLISVISMAYLRHSSGISQAYLRNISVISQV